MDLRNDIHEPLLAMLTDVVFAGSTGKVVAEIPGIVAGAAAEERGEV